MKLTSLLPSLFLISLIVGCSSTEHHNAATNTAHKEDLSKTSQAVARTNGEYFTVLKFEKGTKRLSEASKRDLKAFVASAQKDGREIDDIKILAWADQEYPATGTKLSDHDITMAKERSKAIEKYLKDDLKTDGNYASYNMAKRPNRVSEFFHADDYKTKRIFEKSGAAPSGTELSAFMNSKASKAVIMVDYE